jgi:hypothetical protein
VPKATFVPSEDSRFTHYVQNDQGVAVGLITEEVNPARGTTMYVELNSGGREVRSIEDAQIYADMVLSGEWTKVSSGEVPGPFDY